MEQKMKMTVRIVIIPEAAFLADKMKIKKERIPEMRMTKPSLVGLLSVAAFILPWLSSVAAQANSETRQIPSLAEKSPANGSSINKVRWSFILSGISAVYGPQRENVFYLGEPLVAVVSLGNRGKEAVKLPDSFEASVIKSHWKLDRMLKGKTEIVPISPKEIPGKAKYVLQGKEGIEQRIQLGEAKMPGKYRLGFTPPWGDVLEKEIYFEIVIPQAKAENMQMHLRRALRMRWAGKQKESEQELQKLLELNPNSASAYVELATLREQQRRFPEAIACLDKAISLAETGADKFNNTPRYWLDEWAGELKGYLKRLKQKAGAAK
jgi:hypothetical protein